MSSLDLSKAVIVFLNFWKSWKMLLAVVFLSVFLSISLLMSVFARRGMDWVFEFQVKYTERHLSMKDASGRTIDGLVLCGVLGHDCEIHEPPRTEVSHFPRGY